MNNYGFSDAAVAVLKERYLHKDPDTGEQETIPRMFNRVAKYVAQGDVDKQRAYFDIMYHCDFLPNSPTLMNAGREGKAAQLSACYVLPVEDSMEGIYTALKNQALIHKYGGGTGFNFSPLRPKGARVGTTNGLASGPLSFMELFDISTEKVMQGGMRRGANMGILNIDHEDIWDFINAKRNGGTLSNFNISVGMTDAFMDKVVNEKLSNYEKMVWEAIIRCAWESGDPGLIFFDTINAHNHAPHLGPITATNPCGESPLHDYEACNLGSINLSNFVEENPYWEGEGAQYFRGRYIDYQRLEHVVSLAVSFLNDVIDVNRYPLPEIDERVRELRTIGLGVMGWADMLFKLGIRYGSTQSFMLAHEVMRIIRETAWQAAESYGNSAVTCIAPTGTISLIAGCSSGIEPHFALEYDRIAFDKDEDENGESKRKVLHYVNPEYKIALRDRDWRIDAGVFVTAHDIRPLDHVTMQSMFQDYTDLAVSKTVNLPHDATLEDVEEVYIKAWKKHCKGVTVFRDGCKDSQVLYRTADDGAQSGKCPECGSSDIIHESGCKRCAKCGWSPCSI